MIKKRTLNVKARKAFDLSGSELVKTSHFASGPGLPLVVEPAIPDVNLVQWAHESRPWIEERLLEHGAILFRNFDNRSIADFESFTGVICPDLFSGYGDLPREQESQNLYESTPYPADQTIHFHNEASHTDRWPMKQLFLSVTVAARGGETPIVDCRKIYSALDPSLVRKFSAQGLRYVRNFVEGFDVSWQEFFRTDDQNQVARYCEKFSIDLQWRRDGGLRVSQICPAVVRHPKTGEMIFFNQLQLHHPRLLPPGVRESLAAVFSAEDFPRSVCFGDGSPIEDATVEAVLQAYADNAVSFAWEEGDILLVDNMLTAHSRNPYQGQRKIVVAMGEMLRRNDLAGWDPWKAHTASTQ
jgi:alpha-ketoglutarate-dependent taurine dioxygenase